MLYAVCSGLTITEQFLAERCAAQSARYNGQYIQSSLLQNSGGKADNALICCTACLASVSAFSPPCKDFFKRGLP